MPFALHFVVDEFLLHVMYFSKKENSKNGNKVEEMLDYAKSGMQRCSNVISFHRPSSC